MGTFGTPSSYNNTGVLGSATNPTTAQGLSRDRENQKAILELPGTQSWVEKTITDGVIIPTSAEIIVLPEGGAPTDSLTTIALTSDGTTTLHEGMTIRLKAANSDTITVVHGAGTNNISTIDGNNVVLDTTWYLELKLINSLWVQQETSAYITANEAKITAETASTPASDTTRGIGRVATAADAAVGSTITNGPAFLDAATWKVSATPANGVIPLSDASGTLASWVDPVSAVSGLARNLKVSATGTNANVSCTADEVIVKNSNNKYLTLRGVSVSAAVSSSGAGGLDTDTIAANTWYYTHIIHNPTTIVTALLLSLSSTAPTLPSGYTYCARVGAIRTDATNKYPLRFTQAGRKVEYKPLAGSNLTNYPTMASGAIGVWSPSTFAPVAVSTSAFVPPTATSVKIFGYNGGGTASWALASSAVGGGWGSNTTPIISNAVYNTAAFNVLAEFILESSSVYYATSGAEPTLKAVGWEDNL